MKNKKINISEITLEDRNKNYGNIEDIDIYDDYLMEESNLFFNKKMAIERRKCIMYDVENFLKNDDDVLLIKGQVNDLNVRRGNIIGYFLNKYYGIENIDIEVFILQVSNKDELIRRIQSKLWFKEMKDEKEKERLDIILIFWFKRNNVLLSLFIFLIIYTDILAHNLHETIIRSDKISSLKYFSLPAKKSSNLMLNKFNNCIIISPFKSSIIVS